MGRAALRVVLRITLALGLVTVLLLNARLCAYAVPDLFLMMQPRADLELGANPINFDADFRSGCVDGQAIATHAHPFTISPERLSSIDLPVLDESDILPAMNGGPEWPLGPYVPAGAAHERGLRWYVDAALSRSEKLRYREQLEARIPSAGELSNLKQLVPGEKRGSWQQLETSRRGIQEHRLHFANEQTVVARVDPVEHHLTLSYLRGSPFPRHPSSLFEYTMRVYEPLGIYFDTTGRRIAIRRCEHDSWYVLDVSSGVVVLDGHAR